MTEPKPEGEDTVDDAAVAAEAEAATDTTAESNGKHAAGEDVETAEETPVEAAKPKRQTDWSRVLAFGVLPALAFLLALGAGALKFVDSGTRDSEIARQQSVQAARDTTVAMLSYTPDNVEKQLTDARSRLTGEFLGTYTQFTTTMVIPKAKQQNISAVANVAEASSVSANPGRAVVLLFLDQTVTVGGGVPADTNSSVRVTLDKVGDRWLISQFNPV